ncbi:MAG TPA: hypothetical protein VJN39_10450 [Gemmatimonadales bacterium]|nr:hypothetical protein [Gemmatimonadales bacterium]
MPVGCGVTRSGGPLGLWCLLAVAAPAQVVPNLAARYLHPTEVSDARALWVNPAGLGRFEQASVHLDFTVGEPGAKGRLRQVSAGFNSRGLSFGYQRDIFDGGVRGGTYRIGVAAGHAKLAAGAAVSLYRGGTSSSGWDLGALYEWTPALTLGGVIQAIGQPRVRDSTLRVTYVPSATLGLSGGRLALSGLSRLTTDGVQGYAFAARAGLRSTARLPIGLVARLETDRSLHRAGFAFGIALGGADVAGAIALTPGDLHRLDTFSLYGVSTRRLSR